MDKKLNQHLAVDGGTPAVTKSMPAWPPDWPEIRASVQQALDDNSWGKYHAPPLDQLVESMAAYHGVDHVWPCSSGTVAVELALRGCGVNHGDEVVLAGYDFPGNFRAIEAIGATPVLVDVRPGGWVVDADRLQRAFTQKTRAVIVSHLHGQLADVAAIASSCQRQGIAVVEDACQVAGASVTERRAGSAGDAGTLSFGGSKLLTAGRGGAVLTQRAEVVQRIKVFAERGNDAFPLSQLQAAVLTPQLKRLDAMTQQRLASAIELRQLLQGLDHFATSDDPWIGPHRPAFYKFPVWCSKPEFRAEVIAALQAEGVPVDAGFRGFTKRSPRRCRQATDLTHSQRAADGTLLLHHPALLGDSQYLGELASAFGKVDKWLSVSQ